ncbi:hypothetical protein LCGC14_1055890 [marine sediment metagenome]|uniref:Uncharacterized protein n=1 Tax=marine sediment metagenome TaxID=412755 RepID=A0A0F9MMJ8_9ZZZZ
MPLPFGLYRSPGATKRSLAFEKQRSEALDVAEPLVARSLRDAFKPPEQSALERFQRFERSDRLEFEPSRSPSGLFTDRLSEQPESRRQFQAQFPGEDVPGAVPQPAVGVEGLTSQEQQRAFEGETLPKLDVPMRRAQYAWLRRAGRLSQEGVPVEEALSRSEAELGPLLQKLLTPEARGGIRGRFERGAGRILNVAAKAGEAFQFATDPEQIVSSAATSLERENLTGQTAEQQRRRAMLTANIAATTAPSFTEVQELGATASRAVVRPVLQGTADVVEQVEKPLGVEGVVSDKIRSQLAEDIATEIFNPVNIALVAPFAMQGTAGLTGVKLAEQIASNLLLTGMEPGLVRGTLRGLSLLGTRGVEALRIIPKAIKETPAVQQALKVIREGEQGAGRLAGDVPPLRGGPRGGTANLQARVAEHQTAQARLAAADAELARADEAFRKLNPGKAGRGRGDPGFEEFDLARREQAVAATNFEAVKLKPGEALAVQLEQAKALEGVPAAPLRGGEAGGEARFLPDTPEGVRLTNDLPPTTAIERRLAEIDALLAKPKVKGGRPALLAERAKLQAQRDIDAITTSGRPVQEQLDDIGLELGELQTELQTRSVPFRGKFRTGREFVRPEKETRMGLPSAADRTGRPSAANRRLTQEEIARNRFPDLSTPELNAREGVFREFSNNAKFEPVDEALVGRGRFTETGEVVQEPTFATEGELQGFRGEQGELGIGAGERPVETAGPLFGQAEATGGPPQEPPRRPTATGGEPPDEPPKLPTLREVEADAFPKFTPEERARFVPEREGVYAPDDFEAVGTRILSGADERVLRFAEKLVKVPGFKQIVGAVNRIAEARGNPILMARIKNGIFKAIEGNRANLAVTRWKKAMLDAFDWGPDWTASVSLKPGVKGVPKRAVGHIEDLLVHTDDYILTDAQRVALDHGRGLRDNILKQQLANGVDVLPVQGEYMRRIVSATPEGKVKNGVVSRGGRIGGRKGSQKPRSFKDIRDGFRAGYDYERDPFSLMNLRLHEGVTTIADKRALKLVAAEGETVAERVPAHIREEAVTSRQRLVEARKVASKKGATQADKLAWEVAKRDHIQARKTWIEVRRRVREPGWGEVRGPGNRIFDEQFAKELTEWAGSGSESVIQQVNLLVRAFKTTMDFSATGVQLGITMLTHPIVWAKSSIRGVMSSMADPLTWAHANYEALDEAIKFGAAARPTEFMFADAGIASIPTRIPLVGSLFRGSNRAFQWAIIQAQTELWKIYRRGLTTEADLASAAASIRKQTGGLEMAALGLGKKQQTAESMAAFAARFLRANTGLLTDLGMRGPRGRIARETLGRFVIAGTTLTIGFNMALNGGKMPNLTDPNKPGWFKIRVSEDNYISLFGPMYSYMRLIAQDADLLARGKITELYKPLKWFVQSKAGIPFRTALDLYDASRGKETNVFGDRLPTDPASAAEFTARQFAPIGPEQAAEGLAKGQPESLAEGAGFNVTPVSPYGQLLEEWERLRGTGNIPDRPFNFETDFNTAEQDERLAPFIEAVHERSSRRGTEGAQRAERISSVRLDLEERLDLPLLAQGIAQGKPRAASEFAYAWDDYTQQMVGVYASEYLGLESNRQTEEGRLLQAYQQIEMRDFRDPETLEVDRDAFFAAKDSAFSALPPDLQLSIEGNIRSENPDVQEAEAQIKEAKRLRSEFYEMPKYLDPGKTNAEMLAYEDRLTEFMAFVVEELARAQREFGEDFSLTRPEAAIILGERDFGDKQLGEDAALIFRGKVKRNPERLEFLDTHQEVLARFFPNLYRLKAAREMLSDELFEAVITK